MGTEYTASTTIRCWKQHECVGCGCQFRYRFERTVQGKGNSQREARRTARKNVERTIENEVDVRPCPSCGRVQPDMVGQTKAGCHAIIAWVSLGLLAVAVILGASHAITYSMAGFFAALIALLAAAAHFAVAWPNPNADTDANKNQAEQFVDDGTLEIVVTGRQRGVDDPPKAMGIPHWLGLIAIAWSAVVLLAPVLAKSIGRWPTNPQYVPEVVGPGDDFKMRFDTSIEAVKGYWSGHPTVSLLNADEVGATHISGTGKTNNWGDTITGKRVSNSTTTPYAYIQIPSDPKLVGKTLKLRVTMNVNYPHKSGDHFDNQQTQMTRDIAVTLAAPGAGTHYTRTFWLAAIAGTLLCASGGFYLRSLGKELRKHANPADIRSIRDKSDDEEIDDEDDDRPRRRSKRRRDDD